jgi:hypothetical protein
MVAGRLIRRIGAVGGVGDVPHARAVLHSGFASAVSSGSSRTGVVGVMPIAAGRPKRKTEAVAAAPNVPVSRSRYRCVAPAINSIAACAVVVLVVLFAKL